MVHETAVHRVDAELALGVEPPIDPAVAVDGVGDSPRTSPDRVRLRGNGEQLRLAATDQPVRWTIVRDPTGFTWAADPTGFTRAADDPGPQPPPDGAPTATVHASAADLYLLLWGHRPTTDPRLTVTGDPALLAHWRQRAVI